MKNAKICSANSVDLTYDTIYLTWLWNGPVGPGMIGTRKGNIAVV